MANVWVYHVTVLLLVLSGITEAESSIERNDRGSPDAAKRPPDAWSAPLSQKKKRTTEEDEGSDISAAAYLRALAGDDDDEKRAKSSFRGDLGKRTMMTDGMSSDDDAAEYQAEQPGRWAAAAADEKRFKVSSRFRGDLGKRAKSSFRGDLGKRFRYAISDDDDDSTADGRIPSYRFRGDKTGQTNDEMQYTDPAETGSRPFLRMRGN